MEKKIFSVQDIELRNHCLRVGKLSYDLSTYIGLDPREIINIMIGGCFHDVGKVNIPNKILNKSTKLTKKEFDTVKSHAVHSYIILKEQGFKEDICKITKHHHENYNGSGYPDGLKEEKIPLGSRVLRVTDMFDALTSDRAYRRKQK